MANGIDKSNISDEMLLAYIDGVLAEPERTQLEQLIAASVVLRHRIEVMAGGSRAFAEAYELLLEQAPVAKLRGGLENALEAREAALRPEPSGPGWRYALAACLLVATFAGGLLTSHIVDIPGWSTVKPTQTAAKGWRQAVADYHALYTSETFAGAPDEPLKHIANLRRVSARVGLNVTFDKIVFKNLQFKGARILNFNGKPLLQLAYLRGSRPVALCIVKDAKPAQNVQNERRNNLNIAHWRGNGFGFMVIGDVPETELGTLAKQLRLRFS